MAFFLSRLQQNRGAQNMRRSQSIHYTNADIFKDLCVSICPEGKFSTLGTVSLWDVVISLMSWTCMGSPFLERSIDLSSLPKTLSALSWGNESRRLSACREVREWAGIGDTGGRGGKYQKEKNQLMFQKYHHAIVCMFKRKRIPTGLCGGIQNGIQLGIGLEG